jgi:putative Mg2+ transporter-C (MgtC) family protein
MLVTVYQLHWMTEVPLDTIRADPTRMAQGIMTGIGFLGAGVIFKEGLTVRGLTTAASIWITSAIGILVGIGFWYPAILGAIAVLLVLAVFRFVEARLPSEFYAHHMLRFSRDRAMSEADVQKLIRDHGFTVANLSSRLIEGGEQFEYRMTIKSRDRGNADRLSRHLRGLPTLSNSVFRRSVTSGFIDIESAGNSALDFRRRPNGYRARNRTGRRDSRPCSRPASAMLAERGHHAGSPARRGNRVAW